MLIHNYNLNNVKDNLKKFPWLNLLMPLTLLQNLCESSLNSVSLHICKCIIIRSMNYKYDAMKTGNKVAKYYNQVIIYFLFLTTLTIELMTLLFLVSLNISFEPFRNMLFPHLGQCQLNLITAFSILLSSIFRKLPVISFMLFAEHDIWMISTKQFCFFCWNPYWLYYVVAFYA